MVIWFQVHTDLERLIVSLLNNVLNLKGMPEGIRMPKESNGITAKYNELKSNFQTLITSFTSAIMDSSKTLFSRNQPSTQDTAGKISQKFNSILINWNN